MSMFILLGLLGMLVVLYFRRSILSLCSEESNLVYILRNVKWLQNPWLSGICLFMINAVLFCSVVLILYVSMMISIPYIHLVIMLLAVIGSIFLWGIMNKVWQGTRRNRLKMATVGSSFYFILAIVFLYMYVTLQLSYPDEDIFMKGIGILFALIVTTIAFVVCFVFTGFSKKEC